MALAIGALPDQLIKTDWVDTARTNNRAGGETQFQTKDFATFFIRGAKVPRPDPGENAAIQGEIDRGKRGLGHRCEDRLIQAVRKAIELLASEKAVRSLSQVYPTMGSPRGRAERQRIWRRYPRIALAVLLAKARSDEDIERLAEVAAVLAEVGATLRDLFFSEIQRLAPTGTDSFAEAALQAIRWLDGPFTTNDQARLTVILTPLSQATDADVRQSVAETAAQLPQAEALDLLNSLQENETDEDVIEAIEETRAALEG